MKTQTLIISAAVALFSGCSSETTNGHITQDDDRVPVSFTTSFSATIESKASLDPTNWVGTTVGIWAIDKGNSSDWSADDFLKNKKASIQNKNNVESILWDNDETIYYPFNNAPYSFIGYHPYCSQPLSGDGKIVCPIALDGTQDIVYGKAIAEDLDDGTTGFNARYIRKGGEQPVLNFKHKLTQFKFFIIAEGDNEEEKENAKLLKVNFIRITDMPASASLLIANQQYPEQDGTLTFDQNLINYTLKTENGEDITACYPTTDLQQVGESMMVMPAESYKMELELEDRQGKKECYPLTITADPNAFEAGKSFDLQIKIYGLKKVNITTSLTEWEHNTEIIPPFDIN